MTVVIEFCDASKAGNYIFKNTIQNQLKSKKTLIKYIALLKYSIK